jgi:hypothetical protein
MIRNRNSVTCRWELLQSFSFEDDIFLCLLRGCGEQYFSFVSENSKIKTLRAFDELIEAQEHFTGLFKELSKDKGTTSVKFSPL